MPVSIRDLIFFKALFLPGIFSTLDSSLSFCAFFGARRADLSRFSLLADFLVHQSVRLCTLFQSSFRNLTFPVLRFKNGFGFISFLFSSFWYCPSSPPSELSDSLSLLIFCPDLALFLFDFWGLSSTNLFDKSSSESACLSPSLKNSFGNADL
jgi:hypothetical protein